MKKYILGSLFVIFSLFKADAQFLEYGVGLGGLVYWGDLNAPDFGTNISNTNFAGQFTAKLNFTKYLALKGNLLYGKLSGDDNKSFQEWQKQRNLSFTSSLIEFSLMGELHIFGYNFGEENPISPYLAGGVSIFRFNPKTELNGVTYELQPLGTEGQGMSGFPSKYNRVSIGLPFGGGAKFQLSENLNASVDLLARYTFTDYIDDLSTNYVAYDELLAGNGPTAAALGNRTAEYLGQSEPIVLETGAQRGGADVNDFYFSFMVTLTFKLNKNLSILGKNKHRTDCPRF